MAEIANVDYFWKKCNQQLGTSYNNDSQQVINIEWVAMAAQKVYQDIHRPKAGCQLRLSGKFYDNISKLIVDTLFVNNVINYLKNFKKECDTDCACPCTSPCNCAATCPYDCGHCPVGDNCGRCECNCNCYGHCNCVCPCKCNCSDCSPCSDCGPGPCSW